MRWGADCELGFEEGILLQRPTNLAIVGPVACPAGPPWCQWPPVQNPETRGAKVHQHSHWCRRISHAWCRGLVSRYCEIRKAWRWIVKVGMFRICCSFHLAVLQGRIFYLPSGAQKKWKEYLLQRFSCDSWSSLYLFRHVCDQKDCELILLQNVLDK